MVLLISSCRKEFSDSIIEFDLESVQMEIEPKQNIKFYFTKDVDHLFTDTEWRDNDLLEFSPAVEGKIKLDGLNGILFSPIVPFQLATKYKVQMTPNFSKIKNKEGKAYSVGKSRSLELHTAFLELQKTNLTWKKSSTDPSQLALLVSMNFNNPVDLEFIKKGVEIKLNDQIVSYTLTNTESSPYIGLEIAYNDKTVIDAPIQIVLKKILALGGNEAAGKEDQTIKLTIPEKDNFQLLDIASDHNGDSGTIYITSNMQPDEASLKQKTKIEPSVQYSLRLTNNGFAIESSEFDILQVYKISFEEGLIGATGAKLAYPKIFETSFGNLEPKISFPESKGKYLSLNGAKNIPVALLNVNKVTVTITKVFENNIQRLMEQGNSYDYYYNEVTEEYHDYTTFETTKLGKEVFKKEYNTSSLRTQGKLKLLQLDFEDELIDKRGIYILNVKDKDRLWLNASRIVAISDLGIICKKGLDDIYVFIHSISKAEPISGVKINFITDNNQQLTSLTTNKDGIAILNKSNRSLDGWNINMISAELKDDYNMLMLGQEAEINFANFEIKGKHNNKIGYDAFLYAERNLYRPGEDVNISGIIRDLNWKTPKGLPIEIKILMPNQRELKTIRKNINEQGAFETSITLANSAPTGKYQCELYAGDDVLIASYPFSVEEFMPDRLKLSLHVDKALYELCDEVSTDLKAENFYGTPAVDCTYNLEMSFVKSQFMAKGFENYSFNTLKGITQEQVFKEGKTNGDGAVITAMEFPQSLNETGLVQCRLLATVFDESGRPVYRSESFKLNTQETYLGINCSDTYVKTNVPMDIKLASLDHSGTNAGAQNAIVEIIKYEYKTVMEKSQSGYYSYRSQKEAKNILKQTIRFNGKQKNFQYIPKLSGEYEIALYEEGNNNKAIQSFYAYGYGNTELTSYEVNTVGHIDIIADKEKYETGDRAELLFKTPFAGKLLITLEKESVLEHYFIDTDKKSAALTIPITEDLAPNVYVTATLIKPHINNEIPLTVAHGLLNLPVENKAQKLEMLITAPDKINSSTKQKIQIKTKPNAAYTIAVVDEGILQIKNYQSPDPYSYYFSNRILGVESYEIYPELMAEYSFNDALSGGDGMDLGKRVNPLSGQRVKLVRYWSGIKKANSNGIGEIEIDIPHFSGDLRIMGVVYDGPNFGSAAKNMKVADPVVLTTSLPRFLSPGDELNLGINLSNTTEKTIVGKAKITHDDLLEITGQDEFNVELKPGQEKRVYFNAKTKNKIGITKVSTSFSDGVHNYTEKIDLPIRAAAGLQKRSGFGELKNGTKQEIVFTDELQKDSRAGKIIVSGSPALELGRNLEYLLQYPHGCIEQTISTAFPQLYLADLITKPFGDRDPAAEARNNIQQAIQKLQSMQNYTGALTYWPGGTESWWSSIYALHFLTEADKAGYEVPHSLVSKLEEYVLKQGKTTEKVSYYVSKNKYQEFEPRELAYSVYVMALRGKPNFSLMNKLKADINVLTTDSQFLLGAAYELCGQHVKNPKLFQGEFISHDYHSLEGSYYSYIRDMGIALNGLIDGDPQNPNIIPLSRTLSQEVKQRSWMNTQESAFALLALGKLAHRFTPGALGSIKSNGKEIAAYNGKTIQVNYNRLTNDQLTIESNGTQPLFYYWELEGQATENISIDKENGLELRKNYFDRWGNKINLNNVNSNDLIVVELTLSTKLGNQLKNIVITDLLPGGFEIENARLKETPKISWIKNATIPQHYDVRDDRIFIYTDASEKKSKYYYIARAVTPGSYIIGQASADAMYSNEYYSYSGAGKVVIK